MTQTTLRKIRAAGPCGMRLEEGQRGYLKLRHHLGEGYGDDTPVDIAVERFGSVQRRLEAALEAKINALGADEMVEL